MLESVFSERLNIYLFALILLLLLGLLFFKLKDIYLKKKFLSSPFYSIKECQDLKPIEDVPGCYIFLVFSGNSSSYQDVYVGQSVHVYQRIKQHISGHGNKYIFRDVKNSSKKTVKVCILPYPEKKLNKKEKMLIRIFHAQKSYNKQRGGAKKR